MSENLPERSSTFLASQQFATIDDVVDAMENRGMFSAVKLEKIIAKWKKTEARRFIKSLKDETGWPLWFNLLIQDNDGATRNLYGQEALFENLDQYKLAIAWYASAAVRNMSMANELTRRARKRLGIKSRQLRLPFPDRD